MARSLILSCPECGKVREARDATRSNAEELGKAVQRAEKLSLVVELRDGQVEIGCACAIDEDRGTSGKLQINLRQILLLVTTFAVLFAVIQHPIHRMLSASDAVKQWAAVPWSLYGWLFFGSEVIDPKQLPKSTIGIIMFLINVLVATALPFLAMFCGRYLFIWSWNRIGSDVERASKTSQ